MRRGRNETRLYVNGFLVGKGQMGAAQFDDEKADLLIGNNAASQAFPGDLADVRLYNRPLGEAEIQGLVQPGKQFVKAPPERPQGPGRRQQQPEVTLALGRPAVLRRIDAASISGVAAGGGHPAGECEIWRIEGTRPAGAHPAGGR